MCLLGFIADPRDTKKLQLILVLVNFNCYQILYILDCTTLDPSCLECTNANTCTNCGTKFVLGKSCVDPCPYYTYNDNGICKGKYL